MEFKVDLRQPVSETVGSPEPSPLWALGLVAANDGSLVGPGRRQYSYLAECECPDDCLRDHENE